VWFFLPRICAIMLYSRRMILFSVFSSCGVFFCGVHESECIFIDCLQYAIPANSPGHEAPARLRFLGRLCKARVHACFDSNSPFVFFF